MRLKLRIGTRTSKLALSQVAEVHLLLADHLTDFQVEIVPIVTSGDKIQDRNLAEFGGKGLFIKELEEALLSNKIDIAIHSAKDMPPLIDDETEIVAFTKRLDARDCFISKNFNSIEDLPKCAVVGTSSPRRKAILLRARSDLKIVNFRGNVDTRLIKIENEEVDAAILAVSGLIRLGKESKIRKIIEKNVMLPAGGQGALVIQARKNHQELGRVLKKISDEKTEIEIRCERAFLQELGASCTTHVATHAEISNNKLNLKTILLAHNGDEFFETNLNTKANPESAIKLGIDSANKVKKEAEKLLAKLI